MSETTDGKGLPVPPSRRDPAEFSSNLSVGFGASEYNALYAAVADYVDQLVKAEMWDALRIAFELEDVDNSRIVGGLVREVIASHPTLAAHVIDP